MLTITPNQIWELDPCEDGWNAFANEFCLNDYATAIDLGPGQYPGDTEIELSRLVHRVGFDETLWCTQHFPYRIEWVYFDDMITSLFVHSTGFHFYRAYKDFRQECADQYMRYISVPVRNLNVETEWVRQHLQRRYSVLSRLRLYNNTLETNLAFRCVVKELSGDRLTRQIGFYKEMLARLTSDVVDVTVDEYVREIAVAQFIFLVDQAPTR
jgi:hypothetical protein